MNRDKSYHWVFKTPLYKHTVDAAIKSGCVKTKTEYAVQLWLAYLHHSKEQTSWFREEADNVDYGIGWGNSPQGAIFWHSINEWHGLLREQSKRTLK